MVGLYSGSAPVEVRTGLIVSGGRFGMGGYIWVMTMPSKDYLLAGLGRVDEILGELKAGRGK